MAAAGVRELIKAENGLYKNAATGQWAWLSLDEMEARVLAKHPGALTYRLEIRFPREAREVLWADPARISEEAFQAECAKIHEDRFDRLCEY